jgi:hypothetical protein
MLAAVAAWGGNNTARLWVRFSPVWRDRLAKVPPQRIDPETARKGLSRVHAATARADPKRVHPSWYVRALQEESAAVRLAVVAASAEPLRTALRTGLGLSDDDVKPERPPHPVVVRWAQSLWTERLVGGPPPSPADEPVVSIFAGLPNADARDQFAAVVGLAKWAFALSAPGVPGDFESRHPLEPADRERVDAFRAVWGQADPRLGHVAHLDLSAAESSTPFLSKLGLVTIARLLSAVEATRTRWVLQHLPYDVAKFVRSKTSLANITVPRRAVLEWEGKILKAADERFRAEADKSGAAQ